MIAVAGGEVGQRLPRFAQAKTLMMRAVAIDRHRRARAVDEIDRPPTSVKPSALKSAPAATDRHAPRARA